MTEPLPAGDGAVAGAGEHGGMVAECLVPRAWLRCHRVSPIDERGVMEEILIDRTSEDEEGFEFRVSVIDQTDRTIHDVTLTQLAYEEFGLASVAPEKVVEFCFEFLLKRHPKESIRSGFDIRALSKSFPEFRDELRFRMLAEASLGDSS